MESVSLSEWHRAEHGTSRFPKYCGALWSSLRQQPVQTACHKINRLAARRPELEKGCITSEGEEKETQLP